MPKQDKDFVEIMEKEIAEKEEELSDFDMQL